MSLQSGRYRAARPHSLVSGWSLTRLTPPSRLFGANGLRTGPDGRIYVAQVSGSQISAINVETGAIEAISPMGSDIVAPDDLEELVERAPGPDHRPAVSAGLHTRGRPPGSRGTKSAQSRGRRPLPGA